ncbi:MAG TPA: GrpB family protein [Streptosporangiaceae bacterium]|nr:GrpB family protein [Streptosporangiaceae bacterium]
MASEQHQPRASRGAVTLADRLAAVGVTAGADPLEAWLALRAAEGSRATIIDLYELAAAPGGLAAHELPLTVRRGLTRQAVPHIWPGFAVTDGSERPAVPLVVVDYDPAWPRIYARWRHRVAAALGPAALGIEHVGSTSVPGLAAKPIIDIQISVGDLADEPRYVPGLEGAGLVLRSRDELHRYLRPPADRPREVHVHVCAAGSQWERDHLLFRDYLRADPASRRRYAEAKRANVLRWSDDSWAYTEAKTGVVLDILEQATDWAKATGWAPPAH